MPSYLMMLNFELGETSPTRPDQDELMEDKQIIIIDELNDTHWLWQGAKTSEIVRRAALVALQSINRLGYEYHHLRIGAKPTNTVIIRGEKLNDLSIKTQYNKLIATLSQVRMKDAYLAELPEGIDIIPHTTEPIEEIVSQPQPEKLTQPPQGESVTEITTKIKPDTVLSQPPDTKPTTKFIEQTSDELKPDVPLIPKQATIPNVVEEVHQIPVPVEIKIGLLFYSITQVFPEVYVAAHKDIVAIEGEHGTLTTFKVLDKEIELSNEFNFSGKMGEVLAIYRDQIKKYSKLNQKAR